MAGKRVAFWVAVGGTAVLANFLVELAANSDKAPQSLKQFAQFLHKGPGGSN
jgi:hypothetical protein